MDKFRVEGLDLYYGSFQALKNINLTIREHEITAMIGPSGCGKSTLLKTLNRMNDLVEGCRVEGNVTLDGEDIYTHGREPAAQTRGHGVPKAQSLSHEHLR